MMEKEKEKFDNALSFAKFLKEILEKKKEKCEITDFFVVINRLGVDCSVEIGEMHVSQSIRHNYIEEAKSEGLETLAYRFAERFTVKNKQAARGMICERCGKRRTVNLRENFCYPCLIKIHLEETIRKQQDCGYATRCKRCGKVVVKEIYEPYCSECEEEMI